MVWLEDAWQSGAGGRSGVTGAAQAEVVGPKGVAVGCAQRHFPQPIRPKRSHSIRTL